MKSLQRLSTQLDSCNRQIGKAASWALVALIFVTLVIVLLRYLFNLGWVWIQDLAIYLHGAVFMLGAGYALLFDEHVRVDIFYSRASSQTKAKINLFGFFFLLVPTCFLLTWYAVGYVASSWAVLEGSRETGGLGGVFLFKSLILLFALLLFLQGLSESIKAWLLLQKNQHA